MNQNKTAHLQRFHRFQENRIKYFAPLINKALINQYKQFTANINMGLEMALLQVTSAELSNVISDLYIDAGTVYANYIRLDLQRQKARLPMGFSEEMSRLIREYFQLDILNQSEGITDTTRELIREVFTNAYEAGLSIQQIVDSLENTELSRIRARMIARTETTTAANKGAMFMAKKTGLKLNKEWLSASDNRVRHDHREMNGVVIPFDQNFIVGGYEMQQPGDRGNPANPVPAKEIVNCRCTVIFEPLRDSAGRLITN